MFVPSLAWQQDRFYIDEMAQERRFTHRDAGLEAAAARGMAHRRGEILARLALSPADAIGGVVVRG